MVRRLLEKYIHQQKELGAVIFSFWTGSLYAFGIYCVISKQNIVVYPLRCKIHSIYSLFSTKSEKNGLTDKCICMSCILTGQKHSLKATTLYYSRSNNLWCTRCKLASRWVWCTWRVANTVMHLGSNDHSSVSHGMILKRMIAILHMFNITGLIISMHTITFGIKMIIIKPDSASKDMSYDLFHCYQ